MTEEKIQRLKTAGWIVGSTQEFLQLSDEEMAAIKRRVRISGRE